MNWETYYPKSEGYENATYVVSGKNEKIEIPKNSFCYVMQCTFDGFSDKGIIFQSDSSTNSTLLVESCIFNSFNSIGNGGAIVFESFGDCTIASVCSSSCNCQSSSGQFCYIVCTSSKTTKNCLYDTTVTLSNQPNTYHTVYLQNGNMTCHGVNISNNEDDQISGIGLWYSTTCHLSYCSFRNNNASTYICIHCKYGIHTMINTNIIENRQNQNRGIVVTEEGSRLEMSHCCLFGNDPGTSSVMYAERGTQITCNNCAFSTQQKTSSVLIIINDEAEKSFINHYQFLKRGSCQAFPESWGDVIPDIQIKRKTWFDKINEKSASKSLLFLTCFFPIIKR